MAKPDFAQILTEFAEFLGGKEGNQTAYRRPANPNNNAESNVSWSVERDEANYQHAIKPRCRYQ